jgi:hypothetical protein
MFYYNWSFTNLPFINSLKLVPLIKTDFYGFLKCQIEEMTSSHFKSLTFSSSFNDA